LVLKWQYGKKQENGGCNRLAKLRYKNKIIGSIQDCQLTPSNKLTSKGEASSA
jgi:hypothetical protein